MAFVGHAVRLILQSFHLLVRGPSIGQPVRLRHVVEEIITGGIQSLPAVILMAATIGIMLSIQGIHSLRIFGAETQVSFGLALSIPREFAPLVTGIIVASRSGSQLASRTTSRMEEAVSAENLAAINAILTDMRLIQADIATIVSTSISTSDNLQSITEAGENRINGLLQRMEAAAINVEEMTGRLRDDPSLIIRGSE